MIDVLLATGQVRAGVAIAPRACRRSISIVAARDECTACVVSCPAHAVQVEPGKAPTIDPLSCDGCGLCSSVCPTGAVSLDPVQHRNSLASLGTVRANQPFVVACREGAAHEAADLATVCAGAVEPRLLLAALSLGAAVVELRTGACARCPRGGTGWPALEALIRSVSKLTAAAGFGAIVHRAGTDSSRLSRRGLFGRLGGRATQAAKRLAAQAIDQRLGGGEDNRPPATADLLVSLLGRKGAEGRVAGVEGVGRPRIAADTCNRCGVCAAACAPAAIVASQDEPGLGLWLHAGRCTGCACCVRACEAGAVSLDAEVDLGEWRLEPTLLVGADDSTCALCGGTALSAVVRLCAACYGRRGLRPRAGQAASERGPSGC